MKPEYQGGYILDGGVHFVAALRTLLGSDSVTCVTAFTKLIQPYLPIVDTLDSTVKTESGASGTCSISFGTTSHGCAYTIACEKGSVTIDPLHKVTTKNVKGEELEVKELGIGEILAGPGVAEEIVAFGKSILSGKLDPRQTPEQALVDLAVVEAMLTSGDKNGEPVDVKIR